MHLVASWVSEFGVKECNAHSRGGRLESVYLRIHPSAHLFIPGLFPGVSLVRARGPGSRSVGVSLVRARGPGSRSVI